MRSRVISYIDKNLEHKYTVGSVSHIEKKIAEEVRQIICSVAINHTKEEWNRIANMTQSQLLGVLKIYTESIYSLYPN